MSSLSVTKLAVMLLMAQPLGVLACMTTSFRAEDGSPVVARTMELGVPLGEKLLDVWKIMTYPRKSLVLAGLSVPNELGFVAMQAAYPSLAPIATIADGMNEAGLTVAGQTFRGAGFQSANGSTVPVINFYEVIPMLLGSCKTVDEAVKAMQAVTVVDAPKLAALFSRFHWSVIDADGGSLVFEYLDGDLKVHDNSQVGTLTNDPDFRFQLQNLNQWATYPTQRSTVVPQFPYTVQSEIGEVPMQVGHGFNTRGLPGGFSPPDRFVRAFLLKQTALNVFPPKDTDDGIELATGILNDVHIIRGTVSRLSETDFFELTNWAVIKLPRQRQLLFRTYGSMQWKRLSFADISFNASVPASAPIHMFGDRLGIKDIKP
mmetsp:Transcript_5351/g.11779  ORF Transcript_5351/g.11779 Transcript_5351/m.11779 type:complete len:374 (-) Transcript_5351:240-1361(-)